MSNFKYEEAAAGLLKNLLAIKSVNGTDNEGDMASFLREYFNQHGIDAAVHVIDEKHANVCAFVPGQDTSETMIWNGHLDTVPYGDLKSWHTPPEVPVEKDGKIYGRGASDMKSGLAAMVFALCDLADRGEKPLCNILFLGTCDEEKGGAGAKAALDFLKKEYPHLLMNTRPFLLVGEPTSLRPGIAQKGCLWLLIRVRGRTSHGAYPEQGINAISCGMDIADRIAGYVTSFGHPLLGGATAQVTRIEGGVANNMTPDECRIVMDIRMVPCLGVSDVTERGKAALKELQKVFPELETEFVVLNERRAIEIRHDHGKVRALMDLLREDGGVCDPIGINFFTDASILDADDRMDICLFGPGEPSLAHKPDEYVIIEKYLKAICILERFCTTK